ncbi:unnamed protein product [Phytomonas sp. EM1]|nr:unnamed protein product [Phytomonas sp. EM1]|eukprot:CCW65800.1 unnamed protein product [Phytomonas sp. isolate EM1]
MEFDTDINNLLEPLEKLSFSERWKTMVELGRRSMRPFTLGEDAALEGELHGDRLRVVLVSLSRSGVHYERMLAAMSLRGMVAVALEQKRQPPPDVMTALAKLVLDPSSNIFKLVATPLVQVSTDEALKEVLVQAHTIQFTVLNNIITKCGKSHIMHDLYREQKQLDRSAQGEEKRDGNSSLVRKAHKITSIRKMEKLHAHLSEDELRSLSVNDLFALPDEVFRILTVRYPDLMVKILTELKARMNNENHNPEDVDTEHAQDCGMNNALLNLVDSRIFSAASALGVLSRKKEVDLGMKLMKEALSVSNSRKTEAISALRIYIRVRTIDTLEYMIQHKEELQISMIRLNSRRTLKRLQSNVPLLVELYKMGWIDEDLFRMIPNSAREQLYKQVIRHVCVGKNNNVVPMRVARHIPSRALREKTAKQMFHLKELQSSLDTRLKYLSLLPFHEAWELGRPFITYPKPEIRRKCAGSLISGVAYYPEHIIDILTFILKQKNEQDPWRTAMFESLTDLPLNVWSQEHLGYIDKLIQDSFDAKDISEYSLTLAQRFLVRISEKFPVYAAEKILLFLKRDICWINGLDKLSCSSVEKFLSVLLPKIKELIQKNEHALPNSIKNELRPKQRLLKNILKPIYDCYMALDDPLGHSSTLEFYYNAFRHETIYQIVPDILHTKGVVMDRIVGMVLYKYQQGELFNFWLQSLETLYHASDSSQFLLDQYLAFADPMWAYRLTSKQQRALVKILFGFYSEKESPSYFTTRKFFEHITKFPSITIDGDFQQYVQNDQEDLFTRDTAVFALRQLSDAASLEELKNAIQDSRERQATLALSSRLRFYPVRDVVEILSSALKTCKLVSAQKYLVRFLGALADENALECLMQLCKEDDCMHKDVRLAMQDAFRNYLDHEKVWDFYDNGVKSSRSAECIAVLSIDDGSLHHNWQLERMNQLIIALLQSADVTVQLEAMKRLSTSHILGNRTTIEEAFGFLSHSNLGFGQFAMRHILQYRNISPEEVAERLASLPDDHDIATAIQMLLLQCPRYTPLARSARLERIAEELYRRLINRRRQPTLICKLVLFGNANLLESHLMEMLEKNLLHAGAAAYVVAELSSYAAEYPLKVIQGMERKFRQHAHPFLRRCGLSMLQGIAPLSKWPSEYREALQRYREDSDLWIQNDAALVSVPFFEEASNENTDE